MYERQNFKVIVSVLDSSYQNIKHQFFTTDYLHLFQMYSVELHYMNNLNENNVRKVLSALDSVRESKFVNIFTGWQAYTLLGLQIKCKLEFFLRSHLVVPSFSLNYFIFLKFDYNKNVSLSIDLQ